MNMNESRVDGFFEEAFGIFLRDESINILTGVNERNLCGRLAMVLHSLRSAHGFQGYYVDPEYNRNDGRIKTILDKNLAPVTVNCDLIVHTRGESVSHDNLIAVEMKKSNRPEKQKNSDRLRLRALTKPSYDGVWSADGVTLPEHVCGYKLGVYLELDIDARRFLVEYYKYGCKTATCLRNFGSAQSGP